MSLNAPTRYTPDVEDVQPDEAEVVDRLKESFRQILDTTSRDYGHAVRSVHAKAHGIAKGTLTVHPGLPPELAQGLFARSGEYEAIFRISTNPGDILEDEIGLPRGLALKILGVEGDRLPGSEGDTVQDFIMVNGPVFAAPDAKAFAKNLKLLAATTDKAEGAKKVFSHLLRAVEAPLEAIGLPSTTLKQMGGAPNNHPLGETYFSATPYRFGDYIAKLALFPVSPALTRLTGEVVSTRGRPDALREEVNAVLAGQGGRWELRVQLNRDLETMPIEDATVEWKEADSPFLTVATLSVEPQASWTEGASEPVDDALSYNIWNGIVAHQPLGNVNRARRETYRFSAEYRGRFNGCPIHQPRHLADLP